MNTKYSPTILSGLNSNAARFGFSVVVGGDLDQNNYDELIVGAPYENLTPDNSGAIYIYYNSETGFSENRKQVSCGYQYQAKVNSCG